MGRSHPTGVRGLKYAYGMVLLGSGSVAPHWGAWIEITVMLKLLVRHPVASHWGAWIEI